jgi:hypothetical protein
VHEWEASLRAEMLGPQTRVFLKLELLQRTGTFGARRALNMLRLTPEELARGVTASCRQPCRSRRLRSEGARDQRQGRDDQDGERSSR